MKKRIYVNPRLPDPSCPAAVTRSKTKMATKEEKAAKDPKPAPTGEFHAPTMDPEKGARSKVPPSKQPASKEPPPLDLDGKTTEDQLSLAKYRLSQIDRESQGKAQKEPTPQDPTGFPSADDSFVTPSELESRMKYLTVLSELQQKEQEILTLRQRLHSERSRVIKSADIKPTRYSGAADLEDYLTQFEAISKFNSWNAEQMAVVLLSKLEGEALTAATVLTNPTYSELVQQLRESFSNDRQELAALKLQNRFQQSDETLETVSLDLQKLVKKAYPLADENTKSRLARDAFINAVQNPTIRDRLRDKNLPSLRDCLLEAKRIQANLEVEKNRPKTQQVASEKHTRIVQDISSSHSPPVSDYQDQLRRLQRDFHSFKNQMQSESKSRVRPQNPDSTSRQSRSVQGQGFRKRVPVCYNCTIQGHIEKYCPFPEETVDQWVREGLIQLPKNRQNQNQKPLFPKEAFTTYKPSGNAPGAAGRGQPHAP